MRQMDIFEEYLQEHLPTRQEQFEMEQQTMFPDGTFVYEVTLTRG